MPKTKDIAAIFVIACIAALAVAYAIGHNDMLADWVNLEQD